MDLSRRNLVVLLPALAAANGAAQQPKGEKKAASGPPPVLHSKTYEFDQMQERSSANGATKSRQVFNGVSTRGQHITMHLTELAAGQANHPPARQPHEEVTMLREGTLEVTINGQTSTLGPGSVLLSAFDDLIGLKNIGTTPAKYFVFSLEDYSAVKA